MRSGDLLAPFHAPRKAEANERREFGERRRVEPLGSLPSGKLDGLPFPFGSGVFDKEVRAVMGKGKWLPVWRVDSLSKVELGADEGPAPWVVVYDSCRTRPFADGTTTYCPPNLDPPKPTACATRCVMDVPLALGKWLPFTAGPERCGDSSCRSNMPPCPSPGTSSSSSSSTTCSARPGVGTLSDWMSADRYRRSSMTPCPEYTQKAARWLTVNSYKVIKVLDPVIASPPYSHQRWWPAELLELGSPECRDAGETEMGQFEQPLQEIINGLDTDIFTVR